MYELHVTNFGAAELSLARVEILDDSSAAVLASLKVPADRTGWRNWPDVAAPDIPTLPR